ncbi:XRE family transcriptional regulator [Burkholderia territorii]|uniref:response regulator transcription factor n=1 Tax=Burkholderia territorii TaxID=1503055 RepID=UPI00075B0FCD|nr:response regulator transcription factor [Burkholderia territorii]KVL46919.1 XRE family transcriptional regulator [Burkholderia territorii]
MRIAILDDDPMQTEFVNRTLSDEGHTCYEFSRSKALMRRLQRETFDLLVLDWNVPDVSGEDVLRWVRTKPFGARLPIIFMTCRSEEDGIAHILNAGADDYVVKPVSGTILRARIASLLRRTYSVDTDNATREFDQFRFDMNRQQAYVGDTAVALTQKEFDLALLLFQFFDRPLSRAHIIDIVWKQVTDVSSRTIDTHMSSLRTKLGLRPECGYRLISLYGYGYRLERAIKVKPD